MIKGSTQQRDLFHFYLSQVVFGLLVNVKLASIYEHCGVCTRKKLELENTSENTKSLASISYGWLLKTSKPHSNPPSTSHPSRQTSLHSVTHPQPPHHDPRTDSFPRLPTLPPTFPLHPYSGRSGLSSPPIVSPSSSSNHAPQPAYSG